MSQQETGHVLVVDDDRTVVKLLQIALEQAGFRVSVAHTGEEGLKLALTRAPDLVISEVILRGMDGYALCRELRKTAATSSLPILILTTRGETQDKVTGFDAGADDYVTKPFATQEVVFRIKALLARRQMPTRKDTPVVRSGQVIAVFAAKGGVGKTTVAVNLAVVLAQQAGKRVVLLDGDFSFGDTSSLLNLVPTRTILDFLPYLDDLDSDLLRGLLTRHESGVFLLPGPNHPEDEERISSSALRKIVDRLADEFDFVIVDCPTSYRERNMMLLENADQIILLLTPEMGPIKNTRTFLDMASDLDLPGEKIHIVLNRANSDVGIPPAEIESSLKQPIPLRLVSAGRGIAKSANHGVPLAMDEPQHPFARQLVRIAEHVRTFADRVPKVG